MTPDGGTDGFAAVAEVEDGLGAGFEVCFIGMLLIWIE
ncbi:MAG: hypothetical protein ACJAY6_002967 [Yoonia sp.]